MCVQGVWPTLDCLEWEQLGVRGVMVGASLHGVEVLVATAPLLYITLAKADVPAAGLILPAGCGWLLEPAPPTGSS